MALFDLYVGDPVVIKDEIFSEDNRSLITKIANLDDKIEVAVKWDGCCDIRVHCNNSTISDPIHREIDYIHICDLKKFINLLESVYNHAINRGYEV